MEFILYFSTVSYIGDFFQSKIWQQILLLPASQFSVVLFIEVIINYSISVSEKNSLQKPQIWKKTLTKNKIHIAECAVINSW